ELLLDQLDALLAHVLDPEKRNDQDQDDAGAPVRNTDADLRETQNEESYDLSENDLTPFGPDELKAEPTLHRRAVACVVTPCWSRLICGERPSGQKKAEPSRAEARVLEEPGREKSAERNITSGRRARVV